MNSAEIIAKCMAIARLNYLNMPYKGQTIPDLYKTGGIGTKAREICHYCSTDVLEKIICNDSLRFTDIRCLKDTTEFVGIMPIIESVIQDENYNSNFKKFILKSKTFQELRDYEQSYFKIIEETHIPEEKLYCTYTCSLSTNNNSIRMWDVYAKRGTNICFDFAWNLFAGKKITNTNISQKLDDDIIMYKGLIIYDETEKRNCVKKMFDSLEEVYLEVQNVRDQYANFLLYAFKEAVNYMRCFFKNRDYDYEEEYRIVLKVPKDIIEFCRIGGEIKDIGTDEKDRDYIDYKIQRESIKQVAISPFLSKVDADKAECEVNELLRLNKLESVKTIHMPIFTFSGLLTANERKKFVANFALEVLKHCYGGIYNGFAIHNEPYISNDIKTVGIEVTATVIDNDVCIDNDLEKLIIQNILQKKMKKLIGYKKNGFEEIRLFIFLNDIPTLAGLEIFKNYLDEVLKEYNEKYDIIYFGYLCGLIEYDVKKDNIQAKDIKIEDYDRLQYEAKSKVEEDMKNYN